MNTPTPSVKSASRSLDLLELFADAAGDLTLHDVCQRTGWPKSSTLGLLRTLRARDYLADGERDRSYRLGQRVVWLGQCYLERTDLTREARPIVRDLARQIDGMVHLATLCGSEVQFLVREETTSRIRMVPAHGVTLPTVTTGVGKVLLAALSSAEFERRFPPGSPLSAQADGAGAARDALQRELAMIAERGIARDHSASIDGLDCIAAPVRDAAGEVIAAMSISVPSADLTAEREAELTRLLRERAGDVSRRMGLPVEWLAAHDPDDTAPA